MPETNHAEQNATAWLESIREYAACLDADRDRLQELRDEREALADKVSDAEQAQDGALNSAPDADYDLAASLDDLRAELAQWDADNGEELAELQNAVTIDGKELDEDDARQRVEESVLSVEVRGGWHAPGAEDEGAEEFCILLTTGGPALRIIGELSDGGEPTRARLEYQDWGTPWTELLCSGSDHDALMRFVSCFYFGD